MQLVKYEAARKALQAAKTVDEVKTIRDKAEAMKAYARQAKDMDLLNWAGEIKIRAERKAGEILIEMKETGKRDSGKGNHKAKSQSVTPQLKDLGISNKQSSRFQQVAKVPEKKFEKYLDEQKKSGKELTSAGVRSLAPKKPSVSQKIDNPLSAKIFGVIPFLKEVNSIVGSNDPVRQAQVFLSKYPFDKAVYDKAFAALGPLLKFMNELYIFWRRNYE